MQKGFRLEHDIQGVPFEKYENKLTSQKATMQNSALWKIFLRLASFCPSAVVNTDIFFYCVDVIGCIKSSAQQKQT